MKYNRHILGEAVASAARCAARDRVAYYVYATYYGYTVGRSKPPGSQDYVKVDPGKEPVKIEKVFA